MARRSVQEMLGEFLREAAVLIAVFGFLEQFVRAGGVSVGYTLGVLGIERLWVHERRRG